MAVPIFSDRELDFVFSVLWEMFINRRLRLGGELLRRWQIDALVCHLFSIDMDIQDTRYERAEEKYERLAEMLFDLEFKMTEVLTHPSITHLERYVVSTCFILRLTLDEIRTRLQRFL